MKHTKPRLTRMLTALASIALAWWLLYAAGARAFSLSQIFLLMFCMLGIERLMSATIAFVTIALAPIETIKQRQ